LDSHETQWLGKGSQLPAESQGDPVEVLGYGVGLYGALHR
jgi:hypothetical protein